MSENYWLVKTISFFNNENITLLFLLCIIIIKKIVDLREQALVKL